MHQCVEHSNRRTVNIGQDMKGISTKKTHRCDH